MIFGLPSLRLRGLYLAVSTLALHFVVVYLGGEYETKRGFSTGITIDPPRIGGYTIYGGRVWYFVLLALRLRRPADLPQPAAQPHRARLARHPRARDRRRSARHQRRGYKLLAFVISSAMAAVAGALFAYYRGFVSVEAFSLFLSIQYVAMIIVGGMGSLLGALLGAVFVTLFPYVIEAALMKLPNAQSYAGVLFAVNYAAFGAVMILFLMFEPLGLVGIWRRMQSYFLLWPFRHAARGAAPMSAPLLSVDKLEVVYHRAITAVQGVSLTVHAGPDRRHPRHQRRRQDPRRCARSRAFSASTMRA